MAAVDGGFDANNIPYDVLWLDIEHTDGERTHAWAAACVWRIATFSLQPAVYTAQAAPSRLVCMLNSSLTSELD